MADNINVIDIQVNAEQAVESMTEYRKQIEQLKAEQTKLRLATATSAEEQKKLDEEYEKNAEKIKYLNQLISANRKMIQNQIRSNEANGKSLMSMRAQLSNLTREYDTLDLSTEQGVERAKELAAQINSLTEEIKNAEYATGRYYRNVGNYTNSIQEAFKNTDFGKWFKIIQDGTGGGAEGFRGLADTARTASASILEGLWSIAKHPLILGLSALIALIAGVVSKINDSEERVNKLKVAFAPLNVVVDVFSNILSNLADILVDVAVGIGNLATRILDFVGAQNQANQSARDYADLAKAEIALEKQKRQSKIDDALTDEAIAKAHVRFNNAERQNIKERKQALEDVIALEKKQMQSRLDIAKEELRIAKENAKKDDNDASANERIADLEANVIRIRTEYFNKEKEIASKRRELNQKIAEENQKLVEDAKKAVLELRKVQDKTADLQIDAIADEQDRDNKRLELKYQQLRAELNSQINNQSNSIALRKAYQEQLTAIEALYAKERADLSKKQADADLKNLEEQEQKKAELLKKSADLEKQLIDAIDQARIKATTDEQERASLEYQKKLTDLNLQMQTELADKELTEEQKFLIEQRYAQLRLDAESEYNNQSKQISQRANEAKMQSYTQLSQSISGVVSALGENTKADKAAKKISASLSLVTNALALSKSIEKAMNLPFPANLAAAASSVATVTAMIGNIRSIGGFATGGYIGGPGAKGTSTSDSNLAYLSKGESVLNAHATSLYSPLLSALNQSAGGAPINAISASTSANNSNFLAEQFAKALAQMPNPVVAVTEINRVGKNVTVIEDLAKF